jgi:ribose transport system ATP-binding protein
MHESNRMSGGEERGCLVEMKNVCKAFGSSVALNNVSLRLMPGSVHALMGENGAGKSTLMKILAGVVLSDSGTVAMEGEALMIRSPKDALNHGISTVFQELSLLPNLSIAENMFLGRESVTRLGRVDRKAMEASVASTLDELGVRRSPSTLVSELTIAERQFVEIARGISANARVIVLDEPTAALNAADVGVLNRQIRTLKKAGKAVVYISHRMEEIFEVCDTVTVLKDGANVATCPIEALTPQSLVAMMVGRDIKDLFPPRKEVAVRPILTLENFRMTPEAPALSLSLNQGEIVGLAGLEGQGQRELLRSLIGHHQPHTGEVCIYGNKFTLPIPESTGVRRLQSIGVGFVPEDRKDEGLFLDLSISHNISICRSAARSPVAWVRDYRKLVDKTLTSMAVKAPSAQIDVRPLSGGNQQKVLLARYMASGVDTLLIEEPTRGVDIGAKVEIYKLLRNFVDQGGSVLVLSRETLELIGLCDRIYVVHGKTIVSEMQAAQATEHAILNAALVRSAVAA